MNRVVGLTASLLVAATMMFGGCLSCENFFMSPLTKKSCCDESGKCKRTAPAEKKECKRVAYELASHSVALPVPEPVAAIRFPEPQFAGTIAAPVLSAPDIPTQNCSLLI